MYEDPAAGWQLGEEYLSGNVVTKLAAAREAAERDPKFARNVPVLEAVQPKTVPPSEIDVRIGSSWVPPAVFQQFAEEVLGMERPRVTHNATLGRWDITAQRAAYNAASNAEWGARYPDGEDLQWNSMQVYRAMLAGRQLQGRKDRVEREDGTISQIPNPANDARASEAEQHMREAFDSWVWRDQARAEQLVDQYNSLFNTDAERTYRTDYLTMPGAAGWWDWRPHQKRGIARGLMNGNSYLAHTVGAGKTGSLIGLAMEIRRLQPGSKPLFVVPNAVLTHFATEWNRIYPMAKLLIADEQNFHTSRRWDFVAKAGAQDWDGIVMTFESADRIPVGQDLFEELIQDEIDEVMEALESTEASERITRKQLEQRRDQLRERLSQRKKQKQDEVFTFEEMGVTHMFVDEAHKFRKLAFATKMGQIKGIDSDGGPTSQNFWMKTRWIERVNPGHGLFFASGTPITNTLAELYTVQRFMDSPSLAEKGISQFDDWASAFGKLRTEAEPSLGGDYKYVTRFADIANPMELSRIVRRFMDVVLPAELRRYVDDPGA